MASEGGAFKLPQVNVIAAAGQAEWRLTRIFAVLLRGAAPKRRTSRPPAVGKRSSDSRGVLGAREAQTALVEAA
jgi:hypothetical protein